MEPEGTRLGFLLGLVYFYNKFQYIFLPIGRGDDTVVIN